MPECNIMIWSVGRWKYGEIPKWLNAPLSTCNTCTFMTTATRNRTIFNVYRIIVYNPYLYLHILLPSSYLSILLNHSSKNEIHTVLTTECTVRRTSIEVEITYKCIGTYAVRSGVRHLKRPRASQRKAPFLLRAAHVSRPREKI